MKKLILFSLLLFSTVALSALLFTGCKTQETAVKTSQYNQTETENTTEQENSETVFNATAENQTVERERAAVNIEKTENESEINITLSPPDSTGKQYPQNIKIKGKQAVTLINGISEKQSENSENANVSAAGKSNSLKTSDIKKKKNAAEQIEMQKTVKAELSGLEKIGLFFLILAVVGFCFWLYGGGWLKIMTWVKKMFN